MPSQVTIVTPENVRIEYELAGLGSRAGAAVIDVLLQTLGLLALVLVLWAVGFDRKMPGTGWAIALFGVLAFLIIWGYYVYFETVWNGQTPGKRLARLRTIREGGLPVDLSCAAVRNLVRIIDMLPGAPPYVVGGIFLTFSSKNKRLGDFAAGTLVVKERSEWKASLTPRQVAAVSRYSEAAYVRNIELVTNEEFETLKRFVERKDELSEDVRKQIAAKIATPMMARLGIEENADIIHANLLSEIYTKCVEDRGMR